MEDIKGFLNKNRCLPSDLVTIKTALEAVDIIDDKHKELIRDASECLYVLGEVWRSNWNDFDGRWLREQLKQITDILAGSGLKKAEFMKANDIIEDDKHKGVYKWKN